MNNETLYKILKFGIFKFILEYIILTQIKYRINFKEYNINNALSLMLLIKLIMLYHDVRNRKYHMLLYIIVMSISFFGDLIIANQLAYTGFILLSEKIKNKEFHFVLCCIIDISKYVI